MKGSLFAVNPKYKKIGDTARFAKVGELPEPVDPAVVCTPAAALPQIVRECGEAGVPAMVVLSAGFREAGKDGLELERAMRETAAVCL